MTSMWLEDSGQGTVEAAVVLPVMLIVMAILLEPVCVLYTRSVMESTAHELCRVLATRSSDTSSGDVRNYALQRLRAVPEGPPFHGGGDDDWEIETEGSEGDKEVSVSISGHVPLFPIYGTAARMFSLADEDGLKVTVKASEKVRPDWIKGGYSDWTGMWGK